MTHLAPRPRVPSRCERRAQMLAATMPQPSASVAARALALTLLDWRDFGAASARAMVDLAHALAQGPTRLGLPVFAIGRGATTLNQFAVKAAAFGGGKAASKMLRKAGFLPCGIGLPLPKVPGDMNGLRIGTPELVRRGVTPADAPGAVAPRTRALRARFRGLHFVSS